MLRELSLVRGVAGQEHRVRELIRRLLPEGSERVEVDAMGNLLVGRGLTKAGPVLFLAAHMDEVGFLVTAHAEDGRLMFRPVGGVDPRVVAGKRVLVGEEGLPGVVGIGPAHLSRSDERRPIAISDLRIDVGARSREEAERWVPLGGMVTFDTAFTESDATVQGKAFDDRVGCLAALAALEAHASSPVWVGFTVQEEIGLRGARAAARRVRPDYFIALEGTVAADVPGADRGGEVSTVHGGPVLAAVDRGTVADRDFTRFLRELSAQEGIPTQDRRTLGGTNDAAAMWPEGARVTSICVPCRYIHSPAGVAGRDDIDGARRLTQAVVARIGEMEG